MSARDLATIPSTYSKARATYAVADFNRDGLGALVVANYKGIVRFFSDERASGSGEQIFSMERVVGDLQFRSVPFATDWAATV
jgi:hypothetical protein